jgi:quercetin dioxygenase-like cupin family protein
MQITRNNNDTGDGPADWFTGTVYIDTISTPGEGSKLGAAAVHFTPGARTAWHRHPFGQTLHVTEGAGLAQSRGGQIEALRAGDTVHFEANEEHWHGADPANFMTHLAMQEIADDGSDATWLEHVTDAEYDGR